tara:strand:- start:209 stop:442 length:234 start_codon:yes stop_codon:yes gene_type:complete
MIHKGKISFKNMEIECGDSITFIDSVNSKGSENILVGELMAFSGKTDEMFVNVKYSKRDNYKLIRHEDIVNVRKKGK